MNQQEYKEILRTKGKQKNSNMIFRCLTICFVACPVDSLLLALALFVLAVFPAVLLGSYHALVSQLMVFDTNLRLPLLLLSLYCLILFVSKSLSDFYHHYWLNYHTLLTFEKKIKKCFYHICGELELADYLQADIVNGTKRAQNASVNIFRLYQIIVAIFSSCFGILLIGGIVFSIHKNLLLFLFLTILPPVAEQAYQIVQKRYLLYKNTQEAKEAEAYEQLLIKPESMKEIKVLHCFDFVFGKWKRASNRILKTELHTQNKLFFVSFLLQIIRLAGMIGAYGSVTSLFIGKQINLAEFSVMILTFSQITQLFQQLFSLFGNLSEFSVMVKPFFVFLEKTEKEGELHDDSVCLESSKNHIDENLIQLNNVSFRYPEAKTFAIKNINLNVRRGDFIYIVGENGSGKSTLSKLLLGLLSPTEGQIREDFDEGHEPYQNLDSFSLTENQIRKSKETDTESFVPYNDSYQKKSCLTQQFQCYGICLRDNVLFGRNMDEHMFDESLQEIGLGNLIQKKDTLYGLEFGGIELSGGQKQRLAMLRAMLKQADFLVLDEPTSAIDALEESRIYRALQQAAKGKTTVMISHRLALAKDADMVLLLKDGRILEQGKHRELLRKNGEYARMWQTHANLYATE
ncbi:ABC transporter ATP-binding protein [Clostridia bacterium]|nr:ABC transporter ATP-binding protein [Clostridia bacterium]